MKNFEFSIKDLAKVHDPHRLPSIFFFLLREEEKLKVPGYRYVE